FLLKSLLARTCTLFTYTTLFRSGVRPRLVQLLRGARVKTESTEHLKPRSQYADDAVQLAIAGSWDEAVKLNKFIIDNLGPDEESDRKSTRLNSSHRTISYAVFCS